MDLNHASDQHLHLPIYICVYARPMTQRRAHSLGPLPLLFAMDSRRDVSVAGPTLLGCDGSAVNRRNRPLSGSDMNVFLLAFVLDRLNPDPTNSVSVPAPVNQHGGATPTCWEHQDTER
jgi:hypothetical protein